MKICFKKCIHGPKSRKTEILEVEIESFIKTRFRESNATYSRDRRWCSEYGVTLCSTCASKVLQRVPLVITCATKIAYSYQRISYSFYTVTFYTATFYAATFYTVIFHTVHFSHGSFFIWFTFYTVIFYAAVFYTGQFY
jgi:hypothetical protein